MEVVFPWVHFIKHKRRRLAFMKLTPGLLRFLCPTIKILEPELSLIRVPKREHQKVQKMECQKCVFSLFLFLLLLLLLLYVKEGKLAHWKGTSFWIVGSAIQILEGRKIF